MASMENTTTTTTTEEETVSPQAPGEFVRPLAGRMIAGVAQGISNRLNIPIWLVRIGFVLTAFFGGLGMVAYLAAWALVRSEDETEAPAERFFASNHSMSNWVGVIIIVVGALIIVGNLSFFSGEFLVALGLIAVGVLMYTGYINGPNPPTEDSDDKEGVQSVTPSETLTKKTTALVDDSPVDGIVPPPPLPTPTPTAPPGPPAPPRERSILGRLTVGLMLLGMGLLAILDQIDSIPIDADPRHYLALSITILGVGLIVGAIVGRARWLIVVGVILVPMLLFSPVFEYDWTGDTFDVEVRPTEFSELEHSYSQDVGNLFIDLTELDWNGETVILAAKLDLGHLELRVPDNISISGEASVDIGRVAGPNSESFGFGDPRIEFDRTGADGHLELDLSVDIGNVEIYVRSVEGN